MIITMFIFFSILFCRLPFDRLIHYMPAAAPPSLVQHVGRCFNLKDVCVYHHDPEYRSQPEWTFTIPIDLVLQRDGTAGRGLNFKPLVLKSIANDVRMYVTCQMENHTLAVNVVWMEDEIVAQALREDICVEIDYCTRQTRGGRFGGRMERWADSSYLGKPMFQCMTEGQRSISRRKLKIFRPRIAGLLQHVARRIWVDGRCEMGYAKDSRLEISIKLVSGANPRLPLPPTNLENDFGFEDESSEEEGFSPPHYPTDSPTPPTPPPPTPYLV